MVDTVTGVAHPNSDVQNMKGTVRTTLTASQDWFAAAKTVQKISVLVIVLTVVKMISVMNMKVMIIQLLFWATSGPDDNYDCGDLQYLQNEVTSYCYQVMRTMVPSSANPRHRSCRTVSNA